MTIAEKAAQAVVDAKEGTQTFGEAISKLNGICARLPGIGANAVYDTAMDILFSEMKNSPHGGAQ